MYVLLSKEEKVRENHIVNMTHLLFILCFSQDFRNLYRTKNRWRWNSTLRRILFSYLRYIDTRLSRHPFAKLQRGVHPYMSSIIVRIAMHSCSAPRACRSISNADMLRLARVRIYLI